ncbi:MAG TPA: VOC family protein [Nocardioides sp.]|nr:VOC family protein [Nocardioides sp.]
MSRTIQVTFDAHDPESLSRFWADAMGYVNPPPPGRELSPGQDPFDAWHDFLREVGVPESEWNSASAAQDPEDAGPRLFFQRVPEGTSEEVRTPSRGQLTRPKNKVHLDVRAAPGLEGEERMEALEAECERLIALGATRVQRYEPAPPMSAGHIVMEDPEGNVFCLD